MFWLIKMYFKKVSNVIETMSDEEKLMTVLRLYKGTELCVWFEFHCLGRECVYVSLLYMRGGW